MGLPSDPGMELRRRGVDRPPIDGRSSRRHQAGRPLGARSSETEMVAIVPASEETRIAAAAPASEGAVGCAALVAEIAAARVADGPTPLRELTTTDAATPDTATASVAAQEAAQTAQGDRPHPRRAHPHGPWPLQRL